MMEDMQVGESGSGRTTALMRYIWRWCDWEGWEEREREGEKRMSLVVEVDVLYCTVLTTAVTWNNVLHGQHDVRRRWG